MLYRKAWVKGNMYLAEFFGLKLCGYSMACPGLFLPPIYIRLSRDSLFEVTKALAITKILQCYVQKNLPSWVAGSLVQTWLCQAQIKYTIF